LCVIKEYNGKEGYTQHELSSATTFSKGIGSFYSVHGTSSGYSLFVSTAHGEIRSLQYPLPSNPDSKDDFIEYRYHNIPITLLQSSFHERYLFAASLDGSIWIYKINDREGKSVKMEKDWQFSDEAYSFLIIDFIYKVRFKG
jgi:WD40 repeat protein